ncbi:rhodanese-like domain-containing protein [Lacinutrix chionoecetis]
MKKALTVLLLAVLFTSYSCSKKTESVITVVSVEEMETLLALENVQLVDVRTPEEYKEGHLASAQNIDFNSPTFEEDIDKLDKNKPVILYCKSGGRSAKCADRMQEAGFKLIFDLKDGFTKWQYQTLDLKLYP